MKTPTEPGVVLAPITDTEFTWFCRFIAAQAGIELRPGKEALVTGRLARRVRHHGFVDFGEYIALLGGGSAPQEVQVAVDLLTTNETYFYREADHLATLLEVIPRDGQPLRVWSAASSTGEEAYTIAMTLADELGSRPWEIVGTDISTAAVRTARRALYPIEGADRIPADVRQRHCLKGNGDYDGMFTLSPQIKQRVQFQYANLTGQLPDIGRFDVAFLRNVLIYFSNETKTKVIRSVASVIRPGGHLFVGLAETIKGLDVDLEPVAPSVYRVPS